MSNPDTNPFASALSGFFFAGDKNDPRVNPQLRQRLALALMARDRKYPKNLGEGIAAVGDNFANAIMQRQLEQADIAQQDQAAKLLGSPGASSGQAASLAPTESVTSQPQVIPPPAPPPATVPPQAPGRGFTPVPMQSGAGEIIDPGEYNAIDAADPRNRYKPAPAYLQPALERNIQDPERRAYLGQLAGKEAQRPSEVSSTGAAGPFQFTRGTGAQYGIPGNARFDPDASTLAANAFTDDNVKALTARLGREPTPGEMALAHQQGAGTAANMLTGAGNAPANNLAVNNVSASLGPQAAAQKVMGYYGMPGAGVTGPGPRDAVATALMAQAQPQGRPSVADYGQPRALAATPPDSLPPEIATGASAISAAPQPQPAIRAAPPQQVAQAAQKPDFGYVMPTPPEIPPLKPTPPSALEQKAQAIRLANPNNPYITQQADAVLAEEAQKRAIADKAANEDYTAKQTQRREMMMQQQKQIETKALREATGQEQQSKASMAVDSAAISSRIGGGDPEKFLTEFQKERDAANQSVNVLKNSKLAKQALNDGIVSGAGADFRVNMEKLKGLYGNESASQLAARSEQYLAAVKSTLSGAIQNIQGNDPKVTNSDVLVASGTIGADLNYQNETLHKLVDQTIQSQHQRLNRYEDLKDYYLGGTKREKMFDVRTDETASKPYVDRLIENSNNKDARDQFDRRFGPGSAELEIARAQRQARKKGGG